MNTYALRSLHRWIFIFMGLVMLVWLISGILMAVPHYWFGGVTRYHQPAAEFRTVNLSPAEAISRLEQQHGGRLDIEHIWLVQIENTPLYRIMAADAGSGFINGVTGEPFEFQPALAEQLARQQFNIDTPLLESTRLTAHSHTYPFGPLPVHRLRFVQHPGQYYYVNEEDASVSRSTTLSRIYNGITSLHDFSPLDTLAGNLKLRMPLLVLTGLLSLVGTIIGVLLIFPLRRKRNRSAG
jgi:uncharacterized iron-regulated membrane protein